MEPSKEQLQWLEFDLLKTYPGLAHGVFSRRGGVSAGPFASLNISDGVGDLADCVKLNREKVAAALGVPHVAYPHQTHSAGVVRIAEHNARQVHQADALITNETGIGLGVAHADCQGAIFYDPEHHALGVAHAGWRGSVQNLYAQVVRAMREAFGSNPQQLRVAISPSLGPDHAEYVNYKTEFPEMLWTYQTKPHYFDFWAISKAQLAACGVPDRQVEIAGVCTACAKDDYFSYRREHKTGRNATAAALAKK